MDENVVALGKHQQIHQAYVIGTWLADIRAQLTRIDDELTRQRHLLEQILKLAEKFR